MVRYYHYVSATKVEMLHAQIDKGARKVTSEVGADLKFVKASRTSEFAGRDPSLYAKLEAVEQWIYANEPVGSVEEPAPWIYGRAPLGADNFTPHPGDSDEELADGAVLYGAATADGSATLLMGGSARHLSVFGRFSGSGWNVPTHFSEVMWLMRATSQFADEFGPLSKNFAFQRTGCSDDHLAGELTFISKLLAKGKKGESLGECEFLAKRLKTLPFGESQALASLATPLFVSLLE